MNYHKIKNKIFFNFFKRKSYFKKVLVNFNNDISVITSKVNHYDDFLKYVAPLDTFYNQSYLIFPQSCFSTKRFMTKVDLVFLDSKLNVVGIDQNVEINTFYNFEFNFYAILILEKGFLKINNLLNIKSIKLSIYK